jgi:hypothetical protein
VSRSLDEGRPLPGWLERWADRDLARRQYVDHMQSLDKLLRTSVRREGLPAESSASVESPQLNAVTTTASFFPTRRVLQFAFAVAAALLLMFSLRSNDRDSANSERLNYLGLQMAAVPTEVLTLLNRTAETSRTQIVCYSRNVNLSLTGIPRWSDLQLRPSRLFPLDQFPTNRRWSNLFHFPSLSHPFSLPINQETSESFAS